MYNPLSSRDVPPEKFIDLMSVCQSNCHGFYAGKIELSLFVKIVLSVMAGFGKSKFPLQPIIGNLHLSRNATFFLSPQP
ncbi:hypothetical protein B0E43_09340 [Algoriphagus sp. A40]|nr:hypothetical protein B0E43_09340 [Algoriphagus sp. A40]